MLSSGLFPGFWILCADVLWPLPYPVTHLPNGKANFEPNPFSYNTLTFLNLIYSSHNYMPMNMEQTECSETSAHKIQTPGITQKKAYNKVKDVNEGTWNNVYCWKLLKILFYFFRFIFQFTYGSKFSFIIFHLVWWVWYFAFHSKHVI